MKTIIDSQQLRVHVTLARTLNMSRAATELGLTPSGISHCLKALEADLGCRLFDRSSRHFQLTRAGREFLGEAELILEQMKAARTRLQSLQDAPARQLRIGAGATACAFLLPAVLREFRESFPGFTLRLRQSGSASTLALLGEDQLDLALLTEPVHPLGEEFIPVGEDDLQFFVHPLHPWATQRAASRDSLAQCALILPERGRHTCTLIESYFREENIQLRPLIEATTDQAILECVRLDLGAGILPRWLGARTATAGSLVRLPLGRRRLKRRWGIAYGKGRTLTLAENLFISICRSVLGTLSPSEDA